VTRFEAGLLSHMRSEHGQVLASIRDTGALSDDTTARLKEIVGSYAKSFA
jgi:F-type H+-transporting ATPase subunit alpha